MNNTSQVEGLARAAQEASRRVASLSTSLKNRVLLESIQALEACNGFAVC